MRAELLPPTGRARNYRHGYKSKDDAQSEYVIWNAMRSRCHNPKSPTFERYGARGIVVCDRWREDFLAFLEDMGRRPSPDHSLDRVDNDGNYEPSNCKWSTRSEQARNRRSSRFLELDGVKKTCADWADEYRIAAGTLHNRLKLGWSVRDAITRPTPPH